MVCWQCGAYLARPSPSPTAPPAAPTDGLALPAISLPTLAYLAVATAVTLLLLLWFMHTLAQRPLVQTDLDAPKLPGWTAVTDPDYHYTLKLPPDWEWVLASQPEPFTERLRTPATADTLNALAAPFGGLTPQLVANAPADRATNGRISTTPPFLLLVGIGNSPSTANALFTTLQVQPTVADVERLPHFLGYEQIVYEQNLMADGVAWQCQVRLHPNQQPYYWVAGCGPAEQAATNRQLQYIQESFQPLSP